MVHLYCRSGTLAAVVSLALAVALQGRAAAVEFAVSANDGKAALENGASVTLKAPVADNVLVLDISARPPKVIGEVEAPASVVGPPQSVAVAPDQTYALVTAAFKLDPADATKTVPDDRATVIDLVSSPPKAIGTLRVGKGAAGVSINRAGTLALVANRSEGTVSVLSINGRTLGVVGKVALGDDKSGPSHAVFSRDGKMALVTRDNDHKISVLSVDGTKVEYTKRDINAGLRPNGIDMGAKGDIAIVANIGPGQGDADTISVIDVKAAPPRVVNTVTVGQTPEGLKMSPDGNFVAVGVMNGSNKAKDSPFFHDNGLLQVWRVDGTALAKVAEAPVGHWCQGIVWSKDSKRLFVQCMVEKEIMAFDFTGRALKAAGAISTKGGPAGFRTAEP